MKKIYLFLNCFFVMVTVHAQWALNGNAIAAGNFLGTTNAQSLQFQVNSSPAGLLDISTQYSTYFGINSVSSNLPLASCAFGYNVLSSSSGAYNVGVGYNSLHSNGNGQQNTAAGSFALNANSGGSQNSGFGYGSLYLNTSGNGNSAVGSYSLFSNTTGSDNCAFGGQALDSNSTGSYNCAFGIGSMYANISGSQNAAFGYGALLHNTAGDNSAFGTNALYSNTSGSLNTATGEAALYSNTTGQNNVAVGYESASSNTTGSDNTAIGVSSGPSAANLSNTTALGFGASVSASNTVVVGNSSVTSIGGYANWTNLSDGRFKKNIQENVPGLAFIKSLRPVTYNLDIAGINDMVYKGKSELIDQESASKKGKIVYSGFVAQEVEAAAKKVNYAFSGVDAPQDPSGFYGLRYSDFVVPLVKATQELGGTVDSLNNTVAALQTQIADLQAQINEIKKSVAVNSKPVLLQNVPNPFIGLTTVSYTIPNNAKSAQLVVGDMNGQVLSAIPLANKGQGQTSFDGSQLASGTYYYSLVIDGKAVETKKMLVVK